MATRKDVERAFTRLGNAARDLGLDTGGWQLEHGSKVNGISYALHTGRGGAFAIVGLPWSSNIGRTAGEAERTLDVLAIAFESLLYAKRSEG